MCGGSFFDDDFVRGARRNRRREFICECREVRGLRDRRGGFYSDWCDCYDCERERERRRRQRDLRCFCREI